eukprot:3816562-Pleurochrysis_carterae.AAC.1
MLRCFLLDSSLLGPFIAVGVASLLAQEIGPANDSRGDMAPRGDISPLDPAPGPPHRPQGKGALAHISIVTGISHNYY